GGLGWQSIARARDGRNVRQPGGSENAARGSLSGRSSSSATPLYTHLLFLVEPGGTVVCQDRTGLDSPWHFHLRPRSGPEADALHPSLQQSSQTHQMDLSRCLKSNQT